MAVEKQMHSATDIEVLADKTLCDLIKQLLPKCKHDFSSSSIEGNDFRTACRLFRILYGERNLRYYAMTRSGPMDKTLKESIMKTHGESYPKVAEIVKAVFIEYT